MNKYRITKYNPLYRDANDCYCKAEWTSYADIGKVYEGKMFAKEDYLLVQEKYCNTLLLILKALGVAELQVQELEIKFSIDELNKMLNKKELKLLPQELEILSSLKDKKLMRVEEIRILAALLLKECLWCKLLNEDKRVEVSFGYDYYLYVTCVNEIPIELIKKCSDEGIYIEEIGS